MNNFLKKKKILIIGSGFQAKNYLEVFKNNGIPVHTLCVTKTSYVKSLRLKKIFNIVDVNCNIFKTLKSNDFDYIFLFISWNKIQNYLLNIMKYGRCPIFVEKPVALSELMLKKIIKKSNLFKRDIYVLYNRRFYETIQFLKKKLSKVRNFKFTVNVPEQNNNLIKKYGPMMRGKVRYFISSHWIDLIIYLCGKIKISKIYSDNLISSLVLKNKKCTGTVNFFFNALDSIRYNFYTKKNNLELYPIEKLYCTTNLKKKKNLYLSNKKLIINLTNSKQKIGLDSIVKCIFFKKNYKNMLPSILELKILYNILGQLKH